MKWLIALLVVAVILVFGWITLRDMGELDPRSAVSRAQVVAYGRVISSPRPHMLIDEIWKRSASSESVRMGQSFPFRLPTARSITLWYASLHACFRIVSLRLLFLLFAVWALACP